MWDLSQVHSLLGTIEDCGSSCLTEDDVHNLLDAVRAYGLSLTGQQWAVINEAYGRNAPEGMEKSIESRFDGHRVIIRRKGMLLPHESGDQTE